MKRVALKKCNSYDGEGVYLAVRALVESLTDGKGMQHFINEGMRVAIKPNLVSALKPEKAATTHPEVARAVVRLVKEAGGVPFFVESPGGPTAKAYLKKVYEVTGLAVVAEKENIEIIYDLQPTTVKIPDGLSMKKVELLKDLAEADFVINIFKPKGHGFMRYTGAVKNLFGAVLGLEKAEHHVRRSNHKQFAEGILDIYSAISPGLTICDGVYGMHRRGPTSGEPFPLGLLACSEDAYLLDRVILEILGADITTIPINMQAQERGLTPVNVDEIPLIDVDGMSENILQKYAVKGFVLPKVQMGDEVGVMGGFVNKLAVKYFRQKPVFNARKCIRCGMCIKSCPAKCLTLEKGMKKPVPDLKKCIRCFCCEELCVSKAVDIRRGRS